jgi:hypothetical protein
MQVQQVTNTNTMEEEIVWTRGYAEQKIYIRETLNQIFNDIDNPDSDGKDPCMQRLRSITRLFEFMALEENSDAFMDSEFLKFRNTSLHKVKSLKEEIDDTIKTRVTAVCDLYDIGKMSKDKFKESCAYYMRHRDNALYALNTFYDLFKNRL